ncbi:MAG: class III extradiol dioxygenase subunit B-like domain-containing protein [Candidatus Falkowbacteria bacterium]|nr:class III extradiol dioxygenase subunit B-like domain-containing protein [Candidatus Falkowbacteria bacterium]
MKIQFAALVPHSPLLIPEIAKDNYRLIAKTTAAYEKLGSELELLQPETIIIITPHAKTPGKNFYFNSSLELEANFSELGFLANGKKFPNNPALLQSFKEKLRPEFPIQLLSTEKLDYASSIPLTLLTGSLGSPKIIQLSYSSGSLEEQLLFGRAIGKIIKDSAEKVAIIASGDLSHRLKKTSPAGYSPKGAKFDNKLIEYLNSEAPAENILKLDENLVKNAAECGLKSVTLAIGILEGAETEIKVQGLAYQTELGIGYLTMRLTAENL